MKIATNALKASVNGRLSSFDLEIRRLLPLDRRSQKTGMEINDFAHVLKPGGYAVFDYFDVAVEAGWNNLMRNMTTPTSIFNYSYHATATIDKLVPSPASRSWTAATRSGEARSSLRKRRREAKRV